MKISPLGDRILVKQNEEKEQHVGGIIIPDSAQEKSQEGTVVAIGTGKRDESGKKIPFNVKKGDTVLLPKYGGSEVKIDGVVHYILTENDILGIVG